MSNLWKDNPERIEALKKHADSGFSIKEIAKLMGISYDAIECAKRRYGIKIKPKISPYIEREESEEPIEKEELTRKAIDKIIVQNLKKELKDVPKITIAKSKNKKGDTLVIHLTDWHAGKLVKNQDGTIIYDETVFKARTEVFCEQILKLLDNNIKQGVNITDVVILSTGDNANGENIYETQAYEQEIAPPKQVMLVVKAMQALITSLLDRKLAVRFYGVKGNHGRLAKDADPSANWDLMIYLVLDYWAKLVIKSPKLFIKYAETDYLTCVIRGHKYMIRHIAPESADAPSGRVKFNEWARLHGVDGIVYGHYHHFGVCDVDGIRVFRGGSVVGPDSLSDSMAKSAEPIQLIWGVNEDRTMTFVYAVDLN